MNQYMIMAQQNYILMQHVIDRYGIMKSRRALARVMPGIIIDRGLEWWM